jgi:hypothetical protein
LIAGAASTFVNAGANFALAALAGDLAEGGAGGAGEAEILEISRAVGLLDSFAYASSIALVGLSIATFGAVILGRSAEPTTIAPPRWFGWLGVAAGLLCAFAWLGLISEDLFGLAFLGQLLVVIWALVVGGWLLLKASEPVTTMPATAPA